MNIKITYDWLLEYLETDADPYELQKYLSLAGPSVERVEKIGDDHVLDIEITSNRVDAASVFGIAQEAQAILPEFGKQAKLKFNPLQLYSFKRHPELDSKHDSRSGSRMTLHVQIRNSKLCPRFTAVVLSNALIEPAPRLIRHRLQLCGIKSINNVIDISNYLMLSLGQPTHVFDYDKIGKQTMILRESKRGEKITTLDGKTLTLPGGDIIIEDGNKQLIDLCGIMGGLNSSVSDKTTKIVLFVQTYSKQEIRRTSMLTGQRTVAATYFEKGPDEARVEPTLVYGVELLEKYAGAKIASQLYDLYPHPYRPIGINLSLTDIESRIGVEFDHKQVVKILTNLGFGIKTTVNNFMISVPSWRKDDISIKEDLIEEVARIYGYQRLPVNLPPSAQVKHSAEMDKLFGLQQQIKYFLKHLGLNEVLNYSIVSEEMLTNMNLNLKNHLKLTNPISEELTYMRTSLIPSLVKNVKDNQGKKNNLKLFEVAKVYYPQAHDLPKEIYKLGIITNSSFLDIKGIAEALLAELHIDNYETTQAKAHLFSKQEFVDYSLNGEVIGSVGKLSAEFQYRIGLKSAVFLASFDLLALLEYSRLISRYRPLNPYAVIKLDLTLAIKVYVDFVRNARAASKYLQKIELINVFKAKKTMRLYFSSNNRNLTEKEALAELEKIIKVTSRSK